MIREPKESDLMPFTRYAIEHLRSVTIEESNAIVSDNLKERKNWAADQFMDNNKNKKLLIAEQQGEVIGYIFGTMDYEDNNLLYGYVEEVFVDEFYRREGVGRKLGASLIEWMNEQKVAGIRVTLPDINNAEPFFMAIGFIPSQTVYDWHS